MRKMTGLLLRNISVASVTRVPTPSRVSNHHLPFSYDYQVRNNKCNSKCNNKCNKKCNNKWNIKYNNKPCFWPTLIAPTSALRVSASLDGHHTSSPHHPIDWRRPQIAAEGARQSSDWSHSNAPPPPTPTPTMNGRGDIPTALTRASWERQGGKSKIKHHHIANNTYRTTVII